jgi:hypothetical protein
MATNLRGDTLRVSIDTFNRTRCLNLRKWYKAASGQELPGKGGFALNVTRLLEFAALVNKALRAASEAGLLPRPDDPLLRPSTPSDAAASKPPKRHSLTRRWTRMNPAVSTRFAK